MTRLTTSVRLYLTKGVDVSLIEEACRCDIDRGVRAVIDGAAIESGRFADAVIGTGPLPGTPEWEAEQTTERLGERAIAWQLVSLRVQLAAGLDGLETVTVLRVQGATWAVIGRAAGMSRQSAHERWGARTTSVLDPYGTGLPTNVADDTPS